MADGHRADGLPRAGPGGRRVPGGVGLARSGKVLLTRPPRWRNECRRRPAEGHVGQRRERCRLGVDLDDEGAARAPRPAAAQPQDRPATTCRPRDDVRRLERGRHRLFRQGLAEPHDAGPQQRAAVAARRDLRHGDAPVVALVITRRAAEAPDRAVQLDDPAAPRGGMQAVDVLRGQQELRCPLLQRDEGLVSGVGAQGRDGLPAPGVPLPDEMRIAGEGFRSGQVLRAVLPPQAARSAERGHAALRGDPRPRERDDAARRPQALPRLKGRFRGRSRHVDAHFVQTLDLNTWRRPTVNGGRGARRGP